jgi:fibronectin type 3 domain-containing protein/regulation of enolase protein 1 (concanavalin A-like superfamily)
MHHRTNGAVTSSSWLGSLRPRARYWQPVRLSVLAASLLCSTAGLNAATLTFGTSAPSGGVASIRNWTGATFDADNVGGSGTNANGSPNNGVANDNTTYVTTNRPAQGQTFTTGSNADGYTLSAITVRMTGYANNTASGSNVTYYDLNDTSSTFRLRVGRLSSTTFIPLTQETASSGGSGNPGQGNSANGPGTYLTFTLKAPIVLAPNTTYAFDLGSNANYFEWLGIRDGASGGNPYAGGTAYTSGANGVANGTIAIQTGERVFQVDLTAYTKPAAGAFVHPGLLNTEADFERMRTNVALGLEPWLSSYNALDASWMSANGSWVPNAQETITRGDTNNTRILYNDIAVAYGSALRWKVSGDTAYADQAVTILNDWGYTFKEVNGNTNVALTQLYAYQFAAAAEIMRTYPAWAPADIAQCQTMLKSVFYQLAHDFLTNHFGTAYEHYWANWDLAALNSLYAIGVFCDDPSLTSEALNYFYNGIGNGCIERTVNHIHPGHLGQGQEAGRDQGHATLNVAELATLCQMAWNQGVDLFGYQNNRVLSLAEYTAKYNLGEDVPFTPYASKAWLMTEPSSAARGTPGRPGWATLYHHYVNHKGLAAPYTKTVVDLNGPNWGFNGDSPGWDALTAARPPIATGANPSGLTAIVTAQQPVLSWWGSAYATGYNVKRATTSGGPYTTIATGLTTNTYTDTAVSAGTTYHYVVTAATPTGETGNSNEVSAFVGSKLLARLKLDETTGTTATDATGNGWTGTLVNGPTWTTGTLGNAVNLTKASSQYVSLPSGIASDLSDFSISTWVYQNSATTNARIFDFGSGGDFWGGISPWNTEIWRSERNLYLAPQGGSGKVRFAITRSADYGEQAVEGSSALPTGQWTHVMVTKSGPVATLYVNGQVVGQNAAMSLSPYELPPTPLNYLGKSQWRGAPYFDGKIDDFRIYRGSLDAAVVQTLAASGVAHLKFDEAGGTTAADSTAHGWAGTLVNNPAWITGKVGNAVNLASASSQYVTLPTGVVNGLTTCTLTSWVYLNSTSNWVRIFDFGTGTNNYMFLSPKNGANGKIRFAIRTASVPEQIIDGAAALPTAGWHHVAVTLNGSTGTLYVNGVQVGQNTAMTLNPSSLGATTQNRIGRSQFNDPYLNGRVDDFRIFGRVLTAAEVAALAGNLSAPGSLGATVGDTQVNLSWSSVSGATSYIVKRATTSGGPYTFLASATSTAYTDTAVTNGTPYYYVVVATNGLGESLTTGEFSATPVTPVPTGLVANGWDAKIALSWGSVSGATYNVKRATTSGGPYATVASGLTTAAYSDTGLTNDTSYYYVVSAVKGGESANSAEASATPHYDPIVSTWSQQDVNATGLAGNASYLDGSYNVSGAGADIWGTSDAFHFVAQPLSGDGAIIARVYSQGNTNAWAKAGVMLRETTNSNSPHASSLITPSNGAAFTYRTTSGGSSASSNLAGPVAPYWVKAARNGDTFTGYVSADGDTWATLGSQSITMATEINAGLAVTSHNTSQLSAVVFDNVSIVPSADWASEDIGSVQLAGGSFYNDGVATLVGSGADIWGTADTFRYTYRVATGDCDITARVTGIDNTNAWAKAGVMIRDALTAGSRHAMVAVTPGSGVSFQRRTSTDGASAHTTTSGLAAPYWVRLTRVGDVFTAYHSADGSTWTTMGTATISMGSNVAIGLALTSHAADTLCAGTIDNITVNP